MTAASHNTLKVVPGIVLLAVVSALALLFRLAAVFGVEGAVCNYEEVENWPAYGGKTVIENPVSLAIDTAGQVVVFHRAGRKWPLLGALPQTRISRTTVAILDKKTGGIVRQWGSHLFMMPHGLTVDPQNNIWVTDVGLHQVFKFTHDGQLLMTVGVAGVAGNDSVHFNQPTDVAVAGDSSFYMSDGYGNSRIVHFSSDGHYLGEWGSKGSWEGGFNIPHCIVAGSDGRLYVADRENGRVQCFDTAGRFLQQYRREKSGAVYAVACLPGSGFLYVQDRSLLQTFFHRSSLAVIETSLRAGPHTCTYVPSGREWYHDAASDREGNIFLADLLNNRIVRLRRK